MKKLTWAFALIFLLSSCSKWIVYGYPVKKSTLNKAFRQAKKHKL